MASAVEIGHGGARLRRELSRGTIELAALVVLSRQPSYGYQLLADINEETEGLLEIKEGTLYPLLHRLEDAGHIRASWQAKGRTPPRKYYELTASGHDQLRLLQAEWNLLV